MINQIIAQCLPEIDRDHFTPAQKYNISIQDFSLIRANEFLDATIRKSPLIGTWTSSSQTQGVDRMSLDGETVENSGPASVGNIKSVPDSSIENMKSPPMTPNSAAFNGSNPCATPISSSSNMRHKSFNSNEQEVEEGKSSNSSKNGITFSSFEVDKVVGEGTFGRVFKAFLKTDQSRRPYAMKVLNKKFLLKNKHLKYAVSEASIM
jgi:hypothetical protein